MFGGTARPLLVAIGVGALALLACWPARAADAKPIIFGIDQDSTGPAAPYALVSGRALRDAIDYVNEHGGVLGRPIHVVVENDESDATKSPAVTRKLIEQGANVLFYATAGSAIVQVKPVLKDAQVIAFAPSTITAAVASPPANDYVFSIGNVNTDVATLLCQGWNAIGLKKLALFADGSATVDFILKGFLPQMQACVTIVAQERAPVDTNDVTAQITRLRDSNPEGTLVVANGGQWEVLAAETIKRVMPNAKRFSTASLGNQPNAWSLADAGSLDGLVYTASVTLANPSSKEMDNYIKSKHPDFKMAAAFDAWAWDSVMLAKAAIEKAGGVDDKPKLHDAVESISGFKSHFGQPGFTLSFNPTKHIASDGLCGMIFNYFGPDNRPAPTPWKEYQPKC